MTFNDEVSSHFDDLIRYYSYKISKTTNFLEQRQLVRELSTVWDRRRHWEDTGEFIDEN